MRYLRGIYIRDYVIAVYEATGRLPPIRYIYQLHPILTSLLGGSEPFSVEFARTVPLVDWGDVILEP